MEKEKIAEKLNVIFVKCFGEEEAAKISESSQAKDVKGWDSLAHMELLSEIENAFSVKLSYREIASFQRVGDIVACLVRKLG